MTPVMARLREETRDLHNQIETNPLHQAIVDGTVTRDGYVRLLKKMYGIHGSFERWASLRDEWAELQFDFEERRKIPYLDLDLRALAPPLDPLGLPTAPLPLEGAGWPFLLGYFYVMEGSTLGGKILSRLITQHLGFTPESGGAYFCSYGPDVGARWRSCQELLVRVAATQDDANAMVDGARDAFHRMDSWLRAA
jgi:heme oxygenase